MKQVSTKIGVFYIINTPSGYLIIEESGNIINPNNKYFKSEDEVNFYLQQLEKKAFFK